ncbi:hypothetical protein M426DRAFT_61501 [Hypoxylon sp. CI-4A]|nr:hypothetical protein M426DRAFT_61501 [Hypoxylon sp. CI-4A]
MEHLVEYKATIPFARQKKILFIDVDGDTWGLVIHLQSPPLFYSKHDVAGSHSKDSNTWSKRDTWDRAADITYDTSWFREEPVSLPRTNQFVDIGRWTTYRLVFPKSTLSKWESMKIALQDFNVIVGSATAESFLAVPGRMPTVWNELEPSYNLTLDASAQDIHLPYDVRYQLEVCISQGFLNEVNITTEFLQRLADLSSDRTARRDRAKDLLMYISRPRIGSRTEDEAKLDDRRIYDPMSIFENKHAMSHFPEISIAEHCQWMRKVVITPTTIVLSDPAPEPSNRVLRHYSRYADRFIRVQFTDELTKGRIYPSPDSARENALFNRIHRTLSNGIRIGGRHFYYLASGNSQFRENGAFFFCPTEFLTCDNIRKWMGDVKHIRVVAKYAARLGQCFSTTSVPKPSPIGQKIVHIPDIEHDGYCFTDGVGKIAPGRAKFLVENLTMSKNLKTIPSAFQFRLGGSKGVLVQWPNLPFNEVHLRPSQNKFTSSSQGLEVIKPSRFSTASLNRQTIIILSCLGVPDSVFREMMTRQVADYDLAMEDSQVAMQLLSKYIDQNGVTTTVAQMIADGFMQTKEPFFMTILQVWRAWSMRLLREKARILVDQSAFVLGCVDETRTLRGYSESRESTEPEPQDSKDPSTLPQIFLQVPKTGTKPGERGEYTVITGICVIGRNPSLHPGDIRVVEAVDVPALRHLRDVVVFPAIGDRDVPSMCSGGDLDGDDFFVIWDPRLIPTQWYYPPMQHDTLEPLELKRDVEVKDLVSFFVRYMKNDSLSTIALSHVAKSDSHEDGPKNKECIELAQLHSNAVDYSKTGQEAVLKKSLRAKQFPHFMEKPSHKSYRSTKVIGQLYDQVAKVDFRPELDGAFDDRILRRYEPKEDTLKMMRMIKRQHDKAMRQIMNQHSIGTEFEAWSTFVMSKPLVGTEYKRQESMEPVIASHRERFRSACIKLAGSKDPDILRPVIAAAYYVTWQEMQMAKQKVNRVRQGLKADEMPFISFPWIFQYELGQIANSRVEYALEELPTLSEALLDEDDSKDEMEFERLVSAGVIDGEGPDGKSGDLEGGIWSTLLKPSAVQAAQARQEDSITNGVEGEIIELEEEEDEETSMDALAKLTG